MSDDNPRLRLMDYPNYWMSMIGIFGGSFQLIRYSIMLLWV